MAHTLNHEEDVNSCAVVKDYDEKNCFINGLDTLEVDNIIATRVVGGNNRQYLVCFKSWLREDYLGDYKDLIEEFWTNETTTFQDGKKEESSCITTNSRENESLEIEDIQDRSEEFAICESNGHTESVRLQLDENIEENYPDLERDDLIVDEENSNQSDAKTEEPTRNNEYFHLNSKSRKDTNTAVEDTETVSTPTETSLNKSNDALTFKKRKLKSLDDIVRKISKTNDTSDVKKNENQQLPDDQLELSDRLHTLDQTLSQNDNVEDIIAQKENPTDRTDSKSLKENEEHMLNGEKKETTSEPNVENVYWSAGKAYHKVKSNQNCKENEGSDHFDIAQEEESQIRYQQSYHKCRFCPALYSDPLQLEQHESTHFIDINQQRKDGLPPPPLVPVSGEDRYYSRYPYGDVSRHNKSLMNSPRESLDLKVDNHTYSNGDKHNQERSLNEDEINNSDKKNLNTQINASDMNGNSGFRSPTGSISEMKERSGREDFCPSPEYHKSDHQQPFPRDTSRVPSPNNNNNNKDIEEPNMYNKVKCSLCNVNFDNKEQLEQHFDMSHSNLRKHICEVCKDVFIEKKLYEIHCLQHTTANKDGYICGYCLKAFSSHSSYKTHLQSHNQEQNLQCHLCDRVFSYQTSLRRHLLMHSNRTPYYCHICGKGFNSADVLRNHVKQHRPPRRTIEQKIIGQEINVHTGLYNDRNHSEQKSPLSLDPSPSRSSSASHDSMEHQRYEPIKLAHLDHHKRFYKDTYPYELPAGHRQSPKTSPDPHSPMYHHPAHHQQRTDMFHPSKHHQQHHIQRGSPPSEHYSVNNHHMSKVLPPVSRDNLHNPYSPIKPNPVKILPRSNMPPPHSQHQSSAMSPLFECLKCGERFTSPSLYDIHVQSHKEIYECEKCRKSFTSRSQYDAHVQSHDTNRSHKCPYCHRSFSMKGNLRRHIRIHTNEAPYECPICFQRFRRSDGLKGHIKRHEILGESAPTDLVPSQAS